MGDINTIISAEIYKQSRTRSLKILPGLLILATVIIFLGVSAATESLSFGIASGFYITAASLGWIIKAVTFAAVIITSFQISNEFGMGTVKAAWAQPLSRSSWYTGKLIYTCLLTWIILIVSALFLVLITSFKYDFSPLIENDYLMHSEVDLWIKLGLTLLLSVWVTGVIITSTAVISLLFNGAGSSISLVIAVALLMFMLEVFSVAKPFLLSSYITLPVDQFTLMAKGLPLQMSWKDLIYNTVGFPAGYLILSLIAGFYLIKIKEIRS
ncbi:MAG: hypothetical protein GF417_04330 [Candidatus Latescibacteria bacterium]|nr:hypothetical protein [bacterium]MBD3423653.1 hypothetical protein [Candidatus Latescibacterota bacterium]